MPSCAQRVASPRWAPELNIMIGVDAMFGFDFMLSTRPNPSIFGMCISVITKAYSASAARADSSSTSACSPLDTTVGNIGFIGLEAGSQITLPTNTMTAAGLLGWLRTHVHGLGAKVPVQDLLKSATGKPLSAASFIRYVESKYLESAQSVAAA